jgi:catechol 2,3-dioxygenase-like lactoylglutathione lyase family enzyme
MVTGAIAAAPDPGLPDPLTAAADVHIMFLCCAKNNHDRPRGCDLSVSKEMPMAVRRIVANIAVNDIEKAASFYADVLGLRLAMDLGWIVTFSSESRAAPQVSIACEGGSGTPVPDLSIEVDDLDAIHGRAVARGYVVEYGPILEPWGVRRFYVRDPFGRLLNILAHE